MLAKARGGVALVRDTYYCQGSGTTVVRYGNSNLAELAQAGTPLDPYLSADYCESIGIEAKSVPGTAPYSKPKEIRHIVAGGSMGCRSNWPHESRLMLSCPTNESGSVCIAAPCSLPLRPGESIESWRIAA